MPSTFPEAFGMVAAEAAACGALPVCADHSGLAEVAEALDDDLPAAARGLAAFPLGPGAVEGIASRLNGWLALEPPSGPRHGPRWPPPSRACGAGRRSPRASLAASAGRLDQLPDVPSDLPLKRADSH